jgi:hypothetical protein
MLGSDAHLPRQIRSPARRIETAVSFIDTSRPIILPWLFSIRCLGPASSREPAISSYRGTATGGGDSLPRLPPVDGRHVSAMELGAGKAPNLEELSMHTVTTIGLDIAKSLFQVHGVDADGQVVRRSFSSIDALASSPTII